jgi:hypothetical protein
MLVIEGVRIAWRELGRLPALSRIGVGLAVVAVALDLALNLSPASSAHAGHQMTMAMPMPMHHEGHLLALVAMALVLAGVVIDGVRRHRPDKEESHAHR